MPEKDLQPLLDTQQNQLGVLLSDASSIDARALGLLAAVIAVLIFIGQSQFDLTWWLWGMLLVPFGISLIYSFLCLQPRTSRGGAVDLKTNPKYMTMPKEQLVLQLIADTQYALEYNAKQNAELGQLLIFSFGWALFGAVVLLATLAVQ